MTLNFTLKLKKEEYPLLSKLKKNELEETIHNIFKTGYNYHFPNVEINNDNIRDIELNNSIKTIGGTLEKLIGLSSSSSKKGEFAENILEKLINSRYGDIEYNNTAQTNHCGDAWLKFDSFDNVVMLESKNYTTKVNKDEIVKMHDDMITNNIQWGILISWNSSIQGFRNFDINTFSHCGNVYTIVMIANMSQDVDRIDMGIQVIRKLINNYSKLESFPWVTNKINSDLEKLNEIINLNYQLRNWFHDMEKSVKLSLNKYYTNMREYQYKIDKLVKEITENINGTIKNAIENNIEPCIQYQLLLEKYKKNKKLFPLLGRVIDKLKNYNIMVNNKNKQELILYKQTKDIGILKIQTRKVIITINKYNSTSDFVVDNENTESFKFLDLVLS